MEENLVGYLIGALEPDEHNSIEAQLQKSPQARRRVQLLRQALEPLAADNEPIEPPADLRVRTLARVAEYQCRKQATPAAEPTILRPPTLPARWWRRTDLLVAAAVIFGLFVLIPPSLSALRENYAATANQNHLQAIATALRTYSDQHGVPAVGGGANPSYIFVVPQPSASSSTINGVQLLTLEQMKQLSVHGPDTSLAGFPASSSGQLGWKDAQGVFHPLRLAPTENGQGSFLPLSADSALYRQNPNAILTSNSDLH